VQMYESFFTIQILLQVFFTFIFIYFEVISYLSVI
jgi:hypothetical protein